MMKTIRFLLALAGLLCADAGASAQVNVSGPITASATWRVTDGPYVVSGNVDIQGGAVLAIEAGTRIYMGAGANLTVTTGSVRAIGTAVSPILVTSDKVRTAQSPAAGDWNHWTFSTGTASTLTFVTFQYGKGLEARGATVDISGVSIKDQQGSAITQDLAAQLKGSGNSATGNTLNAISVPAGDITGSVRWGVKGIPYYVDGGAVSVGASPTITSITPTSIEQGATATLSMTGTRLIGALSLRADAPGLSGQLLAGGSATQASFLVTADASAAPGIRKLTALADAGEAVAAPTLLVTRPQPRLTSMSPTSVTASITPAVLTLTGTGFLPTSVVYSDSTPLATNFASSTALSATGTFTTASAVQLSVRTPDPDNAGNTFISTSIPLTVKTPSSRADLTVSNVVIGTITQHADGSYRVPVSYRVTNVGGVAAPGGWVAGAYLSTDGTLDGADKDLYGFYTRGAVTLEPSASVDVTTIFVTKRAVTAGNYTLFVKADALGSMNSNDESQWCSNGICLMTYNGFAGNATDAGRISEDSEANNAMAVPLTLPVKADLVVTNAVVGAITSHADGSYRFPVTYRITNVGGLAAPGGWVAGAYLSTDGTLDGADKDLYGFYMRGGTTLEPSAFVDVTTIFVTKRAVTAGNYTLFVKADALGSMNSNDEGQWCSNGICVMAYNGFAGNSMDGGRIAEQSESNNTMAVPLQLPIKADLVVTNAMVGAITRNADGSYRIPVSYRVTNIGELAAPGGWVAGAYISGDATLDSGDKDLYGFYSQGASLLTQGASIDITTIFVTMRSAVPGNYTLFVKADALGSMNSNGEGQWCSNGICLMTYNGFSGNSMDGGRIAEQSEANNASPVAISF